MMVRVCSCVAVPAASSMRTVQRRRSCEDRSGLCVSLERQGSHMTAAGSQRPADTWQIYSKSDFVLAPFVVNK